MTERLRVVVSGLMGSLPLAGLTAHYLQYVLGLRRLGHDVLYLEDTGWHYDPWTQVYRDRWSDEPSEPPGRRPALLQRVFEAFDLDDGWTWIDLRGKASGVTGRELAEFLSSAELFIHVTGGGILRDEYMTIPHRAFVDTDPGRVQMRAASEGGQDDRERLLGHTAHFSFGGNIGRPDCVIPSLGLTWHPTRQPLDLGMWPVTPPRSDAPFTTIMNWKPYEPVEYEGTLYGMKDLEFMKFLDLPSRAGARIEVAMDGQGPDILERLEGHGWRTRNALDVSRTLDQYRDYIQGSRGEWGVAKNGYVASRSGWFSDRSASFLASGRPVLLQSTGFETWLPTGEGLFAFETPEDVVTAFERVEGRYEHHSRVAREIAVDWFDSDKVLTSLVELAMS